MRRKRVPLITKMMEPKMNGTLQIGAEMRNEKESSDNFEEG
jgi:hypothetical protein